ncbi:MAG TPA: outer membrane beta-barrel protein [Pyrinomonadaceae bacterium]|nr:outer membrane beta-barrel protein [Pyrinomonadaceae bacterium]
MHRSLLLALIFTAAILIAGPRAARAQDNETRWEVGGLITAMNVDNGSASATSFPPCPAPVCAFVMTTTEHRATEAGVGARLGYNVNRYVTLEAEVNFFPREGEVTEDDFTGGRKLQGLFGIKAGKRGESLGVFAKARPGFVHFTAGELQGNVGCIPLIPTPPGCFGVDKLGRTDFAFDLGGVVEMYPTERSILRLDLGDTVLRSREHQVPVLTQPTPVLVQVPARTTHNFQGSVGFGIRF